MSTGPAITLNSGADAEFASEVRLSLERAFAEGHSLDNAAVELKTLRMASNVPIARVRAAVVGAIVDHIPLVEGDPAGQRKQIVTFIQRWGKLVNGIGGIDQVDAISALQVGSVMSHDV
jgi:translation initiation factor eIF-2B subunit epsilon